MPVIGAFVGILAPAPAANVINEDRLEFGPAGLDLGHEALHRLAPIELQAGVKIILRAHSGFAREALMGRSRGQWRRLRVRPGAQRAAAGAHRRGAGGGAPAGRNGQWTAAAGCHLVESLCRTHPLVPAQAAIQLALGNVSGSPLARGRAVTSICIIPIRRFIHPRVSCPHSLRASMIAVIPRESSIGDLGLPGRARQ